MAVRLSQTDMTTITKMLTGWSGPLTWELLVDAIAHRLGTRYSRQALHRHYQIKGGLQAARIRLGGSVGVADRGSIVRFAMQQKIERLEAENAGLVEQNNRLLEKFQRWAYNAHSRQLTFSQLERPLPPLDRKRSSND